MVLKIDVPMALVRGAVEEGYGAVADAFRRNFADGKEVGAACAVYRDGVKVVDLWGGYRNGLTREPWHEDTLVPVFSTTKGIASLAVAVAHARGLLSYDERLPPTGPSSPRPARVTSPCANCCRTKAGCQSSTGR